MKLGRALFLSLACVLGCAVLRAPAQEGMPKPGPEMERLKFLVGNWDTKGEYLKSKMVPDGFKGDGWYKAQLGPGGYSVLADFEEAGPAGKEVGHQVFCWVPGQNSYTVMTVGNFPGVVIGHAHWEGDKLILDSDVEMGGGTFHTHIVYSNVTANSVHVEESTKAGSGEFQLIYRMDAVKKQD